MVLYMYALLVTMTTNVTKGSVMPEIDVWSMYYLPCCADMDCFVSDVNDKGDETAPNGIPNFWLTILTNLEMTQEMIQDYDMPILEKLTDISCTLLSPEAPRPVSTSTSWTYFCLYCF